MPFNREARRTFAQFLNGVAVATMGPGVIAPMIAGNVAWRPIVTAVIIAAVAHGVALAVSGWR